jgi:hypothetical protein
MSLLLPSLPIYQVLSLSFVRFGGSTDCPPGIEWYWDGEWSTLDSAFFDSESRQGSHIPWFHGSFLPSLGGLHVFKMEAHTYRWSLAYTPWVEFKFDGTQYPAQNDSRTIQVDLKKDFRYSFFGCLDDGYIYVQVWLYVSWPQTPQHVLDSTHAQICETSGCENLDFSRAYHCKPSPSFSRSPTVSDSPLPTASRVFTPSQQPLFSGQLPFSNLFDATHFHSHTHPQFHSHTHPQFPSSSLRGFSRPIVTPLFTSGRWPRPRRGFFMRSGFFIWVLWVPPST